MSHPTPPVRAELIVAAKALNGAVDAMWNDISRVKENRIHDDHVMAITKAQGRLADELERQPDAGEGEECFCPEHGHWRRAEDIDPLVKRLDVALNGADGTERPLLIDVVGQVEDQRWQLVRAAPKPAPTGDGWEAVSQESWLTGGADVAIRALEQALDLLTDSRNISLARQRIDEALSKLRGG